MFHSIRRGNGDRSHRILSSTDEIAIPLISHTHQGVVEGLVLRSCSLPRLPYAPLLNPARLPTPSTSGSIGLCRKRWRKCLKKAPTCWNSLETDPKRGQRGFLPAEKVWSQAYWGDWRYSIWVWGQGMSKGRTLDSLTHTNTGGPGEHMHSPCKAMSSILGNTQPTEHQNPLSGWSWWCPHTGVALEESKGRKRLN